MHIVTTNENNKPVFSAKVNYKGEDFMVYGFPPPAPKSSYIMVSGNMVGTAGVPDEVAKEIYFRLKGTDTSLPRTQDGTIDVPSLEKSISYTIGVPAKVDDTKPHHVYLTIMFPDGLQATISVCLITAYENIYIKLSNGVNLLNYRAYMPTPLYFPQSVFNIDLYIHNEHRELVKSYKDTLQKALTAFYPYVLVKQKELLPPLEEYFPGFKSKRTVDKVKLNTLVEYLRSLNYGNFQVYLDSKKYTSNCKLPTIATHKVEAFYDNNIAIVTTDSNDNTTIVAVKYGDCIPYTLVNVDNDTPYSFEEELVRSIVTPETYLSCPSDYLGFYGKNTKADLTELRQVRGFLEGEQETHLNECNVVMLRLLSDYKFLGMLSAVQQSAYK